jgi:hypothetical protein
MGEVIAEGMATALPPPVSKAQIAGGMSQRGSADTNPDS